MRKTFDIAGGVLIMLLIGFTIHRLPKAWHDEQVFNERVLKQGIARMHNEHFIAVK